MQHQCRWCYEKGDFIHLGNTRCPSCAPVGSLTEDAQWVHVSTKEGAIADRRAAEGAIQQAREKLKG